MSNLRILAVDDDPVTRALIEKRLAMEQYNVETAVDGVMAVKMIEENYFDVVLTDLIMPGGIGGIGVLEATKETNSNTEVIIITGHASVNNAVKAMKKGAIDYLQKPINFDELLLRLEKINNIQKLVKEAGDLREAMDVTESNAADTIQNMELVVSELQTQLSKIAKTLSNGNLSDSNKIEEICIIIT
jgi:two-component system, OmpR family, response regulator